MFVDIQSVNFLFPRNAKPDRLVDDGEYDDGHHQHVGSGCADSDQLTRLQPSPNTPVRIVPAAPQTP